MPKPSVSKALLLGLDIGGTKVGVCVGDSSGRVLAAAKLPVDQNARPELVLDQAAALLHALVNSVSKKTARGASGVPSAPSALGCACPGPFDYQRQRFINPPNNPRWHGFELGAYLSRRFDLPHAIMNDANAAALAEWKWGAARGAITAVFLTMSTGMGSGLIINNALYEGPLGLAGEIGQIRLTPGDAGPVGFGKRGSVEGYTSGPGMQQMARAEALMCKQLQKPTKLLDVLNKHGDISTRDLCELSAKRDPAARRVTDRASAELGRLCAIFTDILNPNVIVLGTIGTAYPKLFIPGAMKVVNSEAIPQAAALVKIKPSAFDPDQRGDKQALAVAANLITH
jgi:glucokinase